LIALTALTGGSPSTIDLDVRSETQFEPLFRSNMVNQQSSLFASCNQRRAWCDVTISRLNSLFYRLNSVFARLNSAFVTLNSAFVRLN
jgi:hypothetical protein